MDSRIFFEIGVGEFEQCGGRTQPFFLQVHERAGQLDQPLIIGAVRTVFVLKPEIFQHVMRLVKQLAVEAIKITEVVRVKFLSVMMDDHFGDTLALAAHGLSLKSNPQSLKSKVAGELTEHKNCARRQRCGSLNRAGGRNALAPAVIHVDELFCLADVGDDVEPAHHFFFCSGEGGFGCSEILAFGGVFCPRVVAGEILQALSIFDKYVHKRICYQICPNYQHTIRDYIFIQPADF